MGLLQIIRSLLPQAEEGQEAEHQSPSLHPPEFDQEHVGGRQAAQHSEQPSSMGETSAPPLPARQRPPAPESLPDSIAGRLGPAEPFAHEAPPEPTLTIRAPEVVPGELDGRPVVILDLSNGRETS